MTRSLGGRVKRTLIAAADEAWGIGLNGSIPWNSPEDMRHFRQRTMGRILLMGRTTFEGLPRTLDGRTIWVISSKAADPWKSARAAVEWLESPKMFLPSVPTERIAGCCPSDEIIIAGGGRLYADALPLCTHAEITRIPGRHKCDTFMPNLQTQGWILSREEQRQAITIEYWNKGE